MSAKRKMTAFLVGVWIMVLSVAVPVQAEKQYVFDYAGVLTDSEVEQLDQLAREVGEAHGIDILVVFTDQGYTSSELQDYADDFYDNGRYGYEEAYGTGILMAVDVKSRKYHFSTSGGAETYFTDSRFDDLEDQVVGELADDNWYGAGREFINFMKRFRNPNRPVTWGDRVSAATEHLPAYVLIALAGSGVTVWILVRNRASKVTVNSNTYLHPGAFAVLQEDDFFVREYTTCSRIPRDDSRFGGGGGGGGGHHVSSGGHSHGGRGGSF